MEYYSPRKRNKEDMCCHIGELGEHKNQVAAPICILSNWGMETGRTELEFKTSLSYTLTSKLAWAT